MYPVIHGAIASPRLALHQITEDWLDAIPDTGDLNKAMITAIDAFVRGCQPDADNTWQFFDYFNILRTVGDENCLVNLIDPTKVLTSPGSPTYASDGYTGSVANRLVSPDTMDAFSQWSQNSAFLGVWTETAVAANAAIIGSTSNSNEIRPYYSGDSMIGLINGTYGASSIKSGSTGLGWTIARRTSSSTIFYQQNGADLSPSTSWSSTSSAVSANPYQILGVSGSSNNGSKVGFAACGRNPGLTSSVNIYNRVAALRAALIAASA